MKTLLAVTLSLFFVSFTGVQAQTNSSTTKTTPGASPSSTRKRGPIFRANKEQINQAQTILKGRGSILRTDRQLEDLNTRRPEEVPEPKAERPVRLQDYLAKMRR